MFAFVLRKKNDFQKGGKSTINLDKNKNYREEYYRLLRPLTYEVGFALRTCKTLLKKKKASVLN